MIPRPCGFALRKMSRFAEAADAYRRYTELKPDDPDGFYGLAEACRSSGDKGSALAAYEAYLSREQRPTERSRVDEDQQCGPVEDVVREHAEDIQKWSAWFHFRPSCR